MTKTEIEKLQAEIAKMKSENENLQAEIADQKSSGALAKMKQELADLKKLSGELAVEKAQLTKANAEYQSVLTEKKPAEKEDIDTDFLYAKSK